MYDVVMPRRSALVVLVIVVALCGDARAACPRVDPTHGAWTATLDRWVRDGRVDYAGLARDGQTALDAYLATLSGTCATDYSSWSTADRIAFWVNAYNAFTVRLVLNHYPVASIRTIGWLPGAAFRDAFIPMPALKGGMISLDDIEHATLRSAFREPRIHFALVCAARSCPELRSEAYRGADLDRQLDDQARTFLHDPGKNRVDVAGKTLRLSRIFSWFEGDFDAAAGSVPAFVAPYLTDVAPVAVYRVEYLDYDWALNDLKGEPP